MRLIKTDALEPGMVLASPVYSSNGNIMLKEGVVLKPPYIGRMRNMEMSFVYVYDKLSQDIVVNDVIDRKHLMAALNIMQKKKYDLCLAAASCLVEDMLEHIDEIPNMKQLQMFDSITFNHSVHVAVLAVLMGIEMGYYEERLDKLALAGLMHDIGKEKLPAGIIKKEGRLTDEEYALMQEHPRLGYEIVRDMISIPAVVKHSILFHHENYDGTGYPEGRMGDKVHVFARIVHLCDVYDAMICKRSYKEEMNPASVIAYLTAQKGLMFDRMLVDVFKNSVYPYTPGILVQLSDGSRAVVRENHRGYPDRPDVVLEDSDVVLELRHVRGLFIAKVLTGNAKEQKKTV